MFEKKLKSYINLINSNLEKFLPHSNNLCYNFFKSINYSVLNGGKRVRPVLTLAVCDMFNFDVEKALPFASAVEFIHAGSLIHDDLPCMDNSEFRRNQLACHVKFGETTAVLVGDGLFLTSFKVLATASLRNEKIVRATNYLSEMAGFDGMVFGQAVDMLIDEKNFNEKNLKILSNLKTASLIKAACVLGAIAAGVSFETEKTIEKFATYLGLAFQICDDLIDWNENETKLNFATIFTKQETKLLAKNYSEKALKLIKNFKNSVFIVYLTELMLNRSN